jgi:hypothetical protein
MSHECRASQLSLQSCPAMIKQHFLPDYHPHRPHPRGLPQPLHSGNGTPLNNRLNLVRYRRTHATYAHHLPSTAVTAGSSYRLLSSRSAFIELATLRWSKSPRFLPAGARGNGTTSDFPGLCRALLFGMLNLVTSSLTYPTPVMEIVACRQPSLAVGLLLLSSSAGILICAYGAHAWGGGVFL